MPDVAVPRPLSCTHAHSLAILSTELSRFDPTEPLRFLDVGCGDGALICYLQRALAVICPKRRIEFYGFDVSDHGIQKGDFLETARRTLAIDAPDIDWSGRIKVIRSDELWPFPAGFFHAIFSNQVIEHVRDHAMFMQQTALVLIKGGFAFHIYPSRECLWEPHLCLPLAHRIGDHDILRKYIAALSTIGLGKYRVHAKAFGTTLSRYAEEHADYVTFMTNYPSKNDIFQLANAAGLRASSRYNERYYLQRLRQSFGRPALTLYERSPALIQALGAIVLPRLASRTIFLEKCQTYAPL